MIRRSGLPGLRSMFGPLIKGGVRMHWNHATFSGRERGVQPSEGDHKRSPSDGCTRYLIHHQRGWLRRDRLAVLPANYDEVGTRLHCWFKPLWLVHWITFTPWVVPPPKTSMTRWLLRFTI